MFKASKKLLKKEKGVTLVELLAVIIILGIIALIAVPAIAGVIEDSKVDSIKSTAVNYLNAAEMYAVTNDYYGETITLNELVAAGYVDDDNASAWESYTYTSGDRSNFAHIVIDSEGNATINATRVDDVKVEFNGASKTDINNETSMDITK